MQILQELFPDAWYIIEASEPPIVGTFNEFDCNGLDEEERPECKRCGYQRSREIIRVEPYSYRKAKAYKAQLGTKSLDDVL